MRKYKGLIESLAPNQIFVFGSNVDGRHGAGTAWIAYNKYGAVYGEGYGHHGRTYAIATTDLKVSQRPSVHRQHIIDQIVDLFDYAHHHPDLEFLVAYTTKGPFLSGFTAAELVTMFVDATDQWGWGIPDNIVFEEKFGELIEDSY